MGGAGSGVHAGSIHRLLSSRVLHFDEAISIVFRQRAIHVEMNSYKSALQ
jgi:hypothetical protein